MSFMDSKCICGLQQSTCGVAPADPFYPARDDEKWIAISYATCIVCVALVAVYAFVRTFLYLKEKHRDQNTEEFCTARGTQNGWRIAFSFFGSAVGSWCIAAPSSFAVYTGYVGLLMYSIASGLPVLILALCGAAINKKHENVVSVGDFVGRRFGPVLKTVTVLLCLFNMSIAMLAEYTTIGSLFEDFVGSLSWPMIITVGILTMAYTMYGGLYISIMTDQIQSYVTILFIAVIAIYTAVTFRAPLPKPIPNDVNFSMDYETGYVSWPLGANQFGYSAIFSMPVALMAATVFSEAMWQKVWASKDRKALFFGGTLGAFMITIAVFIFGLGGWLAAWAGYINFSTNTNLYLFQVFRDELYEGAVEGAPYSYYGYIYNGASARVRSTIGIITLMLALIMNTSAIDSLQNGLTSAIATQWFKNQHILFARVIVIIINVPIMVIATRKYTVLQLFLVSNMLTTCWFLPVLSGLFDCTTDFVGEDGALFGGTFALLWTIGYGTIRASRFLSGTDAIDCGAWYAWWGNFNYEWDYFLVASGSSVVGMAGWGLCRWALKRAFGSAGPGISTLFGYLPGFRFITGGGLDTDLMDVCGLSSFKTSKAEGADAHSSPSAGSAPDEHVLSKNEHELAKTVDADDVDVANMDPVVNIDATGDPAAKK